MSTLHCSVRNLCQGYLQRRMSLKRVKSRPCVRSLRHLVAVVIIVFVSGVFYLHSDVRSSERRTEKSRSYYCGSVTALRILTAS